MALRGSHPRRSPCWNLPPLDSMEDELARDPGLIGGPHSDSTSPAPSRNPISGPKLIPALISAPVFASVSPSSNELFKQFIRTYLESNQRPRQPLAEHERSFKAKISDVYYKKLHMDCYYFCQQCKNYFKIAEATRAKQTFFVAFFLCGSISIQWTKYKQRHWGKELTPITWTEFKIFLQKNLGESKSLINSI